MLFKRIFDGIYPDQWNKQLLSPVMAYLKIRPDLLVKEDTTKEANILKPFHCNILVRGK